MKHFVIVLFLTFIPIRLIADELHASLGIEGRFFPEGAVSDEQDNEGLSLTIQPEYRAKFMDDRSVFNVILFYRIDGMDDKRTHGDIRQLDLIMSYGDWEYQTGISKVFWGVTESVHLTDIINQTDNVENIDGEEKLGQPLLRATYFHDGGSLSLFVLPYFRERNFAGTEGRLRPALAVSDDNIEYESSDREKHIDYALRLQQSFSSIDIGLHYFNGTSREPILIPDLSAGLLNQFYPQIKQAGLELQYTGEEWLWKLETTHRRSEADDYSAAVGGFEYTRPRFVGTKMDLGLIAEYLYDSRGEEITAPYQNDLFLGIRLDVNDLDSTAYLIGGYFDLDNQTRTLRFERNTRLTSDVTMDIEAQIFSNVAAKDPLYDLKKDSYFQLVLRKYF